MMYVQRAKDEDAKVEYGCRVRRLFPWKEVPEDMTWGGAWSVLEPQQSTRPHWHDEDESFIIVSGSGVASVDGKESEVSSGDLVYFPRYSVHAIKNSSTDEDLQFLAIWWGWREPEGATAHFVDDEAA